MKNVGSLRPKLETCIKKIRTCFISAIPSVFWIQVTDLKRFYSPSRIRQALIQEFSAAEALGSSNARSLRQWIGRYFSTLWLAGGLAVKGGDPYDLGTYFRWIHDAGIFAAEYYP